MRWVAVLVVLTLLGCDPEEATAPTSKVGDGSVTGTVSFLKTGDGVPNLVAALVRDGGVVATAHTGAAGEFSFPDVAEGEYSVRLTGFELTGLPLRATAFDPVEAEVTVGVAPTSLAFAAVGLVPPRVSGEVTCGGVPIEGARVRVVGGEDTDTTVETDVRGKYAATDLSTGTYAVFPVNVPCLVEPGLGVIRVEKGQAGEVDFAG